MVRANKVELLTEADAHSQRAFCFYPLSEDIVSNQWLESFHATYSHVRDELAAAVSRSGIFALDENKSLATALGHKW